MKQIYKARWIIMVVIPITLLLAFVVLFAGGTPYINRVLLCANVLLIIAQGINVFVAFKDKQNDVGIALLVCLMIYLVLMRAIYIWSWNYTVKAMTVGFE